MKNLYKILLSAVVAVSAFMSVEAQTPNSFFMPNAIDRLDQNVALTLDRGYLNLPLIGGTSLGTHGNVALGDIIFPVDGEMKLFTDPAVSPELALSGLNKGANIMGMNFNTNILGFGAYTKRDWFWSFDVSLKGSMNVNLPYQLVDFLKNTPDYAEINDLNVNMESYMEVGFGMSVPLSEKLRVGARVKALLGVARADMQIDNLTITANEDLWEAEGEGSINVNMSGVEVDSENTTFEFGDIDFGTPSSTAGFGMAFDFGATYDLFENLQLSASVNNLGFMRWSAESNVYGTVKPEFSFDGIDVQVNGDSVNAEEGAFDLDDILLFEQGESVDTKTRTEADINLGAQYFLLNKRLSVGGLYTSYFMHEQTYSSLTLGASITPLSWFSLSGAYSINVDSTNSFGVAVNIATSFINLYVATDLLFAEVTPQYVPISQQTSNVSFGLSIPLARRGVKARKAGL